MRHLSISLFGGFESSLDGEPVAAFGTDKVRALLAYLAVEAGRPHRRRALAGMFWPELPEDRAAHNLRQALLLLRKALSEDDVASQPFLVLGRQEIQFNPLGNYSLDVAEFAELCAASREHRHAGPAACATCLGWLRRAADLYRGDFLAGFSVRDSMPFEEWQLVQQEALHGQALTC
jgi:DNA-binding SARP family transcriptional activator